MVSTAEFLFYLSGDGQSSTFDVDILEIPVGLIPGSASDRVSYSSYPMQVDLEKANGIQDLVIMQLGVGKLEVITASIANAVMHVELRDPLKVAEIAVHGYLQFPLLPAQKAPGFTTEVVPTIAPIAETWLDRISRIFS